MDDVCYVESLEAVNYLIHDRGYDMIGVQDSIYNPERKAVIFKKTPMLDADLEWYKKYRSNRRPRRKTEKFVIYSMELANYLIHHDNYLLKINNQKSRPNTHYKVFLFEDNDKLHNDVGNFLINQAKEKVEEYKARFKKK